MALGITRCLVATESRSTGDVLASSGCFSGSPCTARSPGGKHAGRKPRRTPARGGDCPGLPSPLHKPLRSGAGSSRCRSTLPRRKGEIATRREEPRRGASAWGEPWESLRRRYERECKLCAQHPAPVTSIFQAAGTARHRDNSRSAAGARRREPERVRGRRRAPRSAAKRLSDSSKLWPG